MRRMEPAQAVRFVYAGLTAIVIFVISMVAVAAYVIISVRAGGQGASTETALTILAGMGGAALLAAIPLVALLLRNCFAGRRNSLQ